MGSHLGTACRLYFSWKIGPFVDILVDTIGYDLSEALRSKANT